MALCLSRNQANVDAIMLEIDGTPNKSKLWANAILGVSAGAGAKGVPLYRHIKEISGTKELAMPVPNFNVINGGSHAGNNLAMQEFMILLVGAQLHLLRLSAWAVKEGLVLLMDAIEKAGYTSKIKIGMDVAASEFYTKDGKYDLNFKKQPNDGAHVHSAQSLGQLYKDFVKEFPIVSIEDPFDQDDWGSWASLLASVDIQLVGDDLLVTNPKRIVEAIKKKACNGLLQKVNKIGTVIESIQAALDAKAAGWGVMIKTGGAPCRSEQLAKYNQLLRIEEELGSVQYAGETFRSP
ncbi:hypothetical protein JHK82_043027 [Glycine max]|nr:hypothetical protein JHK87_042975 [Glycine soja]KAG4957306.1 hypothetical protein JHK85_043686 [Glycine max]KAG5106057.1 hypothetical protein JHK82_043027 [Glycine max]